MKKVLMGTTAMVAAGLLAAGPALAEEKEEAKPVHVGVKGYAEHWVAYVNHDSVMVDGMQADYSGFDSKSNVEIHFKGSTELDNGLTVGVTVELEASEGYGAEPIDASWITVSGAFGSFDLGGLDSVMSRMKVGPADVGRLYPDDGYVSWFANPGDDIVQPPYASHMRFGGDAEQITYMTPRINGLQIGASYTPEVASGNRPQPNRNAPGTYDVISGALNYEHNMDNGVAKVSATYAAADDHGSGMNLGAYVAVAGVGVGASWGQTDDRPGTDKTAYNLGADYTAGPMSASINYFHSRWEDGSGEQDIVHASAAWVLGPGVDMTLNLGHIVLSADGAEDVEATYGVGGFRVVF